MSDALILVVEDDVPIRELVADTLAGRGYRVEQAANGVQALERMRNRVPDLVVLDLMMPQMTGATLIRTVRADPRLAHVRILVVSAVYGMGSSEDLDVTAALSKPFDVDEFLDLVASIVSSPPGT